MVDLALKPSEPVKKVFTAPQEIRKQSPFSPTYYEWLRKHAEEVNVSRFVLAGFPFEIYEVPKDHTLFISACWITALEAAGVAQHGWAQLDVDNFGINGILIGTMVDHAVGQHGGNSSLSISFPILKEFKGGIKFLIETNLTSGWVGSGFSGFIIPNNLIPQF